MAMVVTCMRDCRSLRCSLLIFPAHSLWFCLYSLYGGGHVCLLEQWFKHGLCLAQIWIAASKCTLTLTLLDMTPIRMSAIVLTSLETFLYCTYSSFRKWCCAFQVFFPMLSASCLWPQTDAYSCSLTIFHRVLRRGMFSIALTLLWALIKEARIQATEQ